MQEEKLEDILRSIRGMIDNHNQDLVKEPQNNNRKASYNTENNKEEDEDYDSILELTHEFDKNRDSANNELASKETVKRSAELIKDFANQLDSKSYSQKNFSQDDKLEMMVADLIKPLLKDWLDHNLPKLVEKIIADELKRLVPRR